MRKNIITERLYLRPPIPQDAQAIKNLISYDVAQWLTRMPWPYQISDATDWLAALNWGEGGYVWAITLHGQIIGMIGLEDELGYWLAPEFWGKGYASEAAHAVLSDHFKNPDALPLSSGYHLGNDRSANVLVKMGFSPMGREMRAALAQGRDVELQKMMLTPEQWHAINPVSIHAGDMTLLPVTATDFDALYGIFGNKDVAWQLGRWPHPLDPALLRKRLVTMRWRGQWGATFKITLPHDQTIGIIGFHSDSNGQKDDISIGYALHPNHWGSGHMTQAVRAMTQFIFDRYPVSQIFASAVIDNPASQRVLIKNGFVEYDRVQYVQSSRNYEVTSLEYRSKRP